MTALNEKVSTIEVIKPERKFLVMKGYPPGCWSNVMDIFPGK
jgi:hypothetical protein